MAGRERGARRLRSPPGRGDVAPVGPPAVAERLQGQVCSRRRRCNRRQPGDGSTPPAPPASRRQHGRRGHPQAGIVGRLCQPSKSTVEGRGRRPGDRLEDGGVEGFEAASPAAPPGSPRPAAPSPPRQRSVPGQAPRAAMGKAVHPGHQRKNHARRCGQALGKPAYERGRREHECRDRGAPPRPARFCARLHGVTFGQSAGPAGTIDTGRPACSASSCDRLPARISRAPVSPREPITITAASMSIALPSAGGAVVTDENGSVGHCGLLVVSGPGLAEAPPAPPPGLTPELLITSMTAAASG